MRRSSCVPRLLAIVCCAALLVVSAAVSASAQRLRSPASSLMLAVPTVTCGTSPRVNLSWTDTAPSATGTYRVMSNVVGGKANAWSAGVYLGNVRAASIGAANGSSWQFAIDALTSVTRDSNVVSITVNCAPADGTAPSAPTITSATAPSCSSVSLAWTASTDTGGSGLAGYNVYRDGSFVQRVTAPATSWVNSGLTALTTYSYKVSAIDNAGNQSAQSSAVGVTTPSCANQAPHANAGADQSAPTLVSVTFNGSGSTDSDGTIASYSWNFGDSSTGTGVTASHSYASAGAYTVTLTVTDNQGATGSDTATISVSNRAPVANAGPDQSATAGAAVSFGGSGSSDPDGTISSYSWNFGDGTTGTGVTASHSYAAAGTFTVTLTVTDNKGAVASDTAVVTVGAVANQPPHANAGVDQSASTLASVSFNGSASFDPDGTISSYAWSFGDGTTGTGATASHSYASSGVYTVTLTVTDNKGATATDNAVISITNRPPVANAGADKSASAGTSVSFSGAASSDADGTISSYGWSFGDGATGSGVSVSHTYASSGTYTATLTVTDNKGATASDTAVVTVSSTAPSNWARGLGSSGSDAGYAVAGDAVGSTIVGGTYHGTVNFGGTTLTSAGGADWFLAKYSATGVLQWARGAGGLADDVLVALAVDTNGDIVATGRFSGTSSFGGTALVASGSSDMVVAKYAGVDGAHQWSKNFGGIYDDEASAVAVDASNNVYITGFFSGSITFGGSILRVPFVTDLDVFVAKFTSAGAHVWSKNFTNYGDERGYGIAVDAAGNVAITGFFSNSIDFGGGPLTSSGAMTDIFLARFTTAGVYSWAQRIGSANDNEAGYAATMDTTGNVIITGYALQPVDFGGGVLPTFGNTDAFVAKYAAASGAHMWSRRMGGQGYDYGYGVSVDAANNVYVVGSFDGPANFGGISLTPAGFSDGFVAKYSSTGALQWAKALGGSGSDVARAVGIAGGSPVATGYFYATGTFDATMLTSAGGADAFVTKLNP